MFRKSLNRKNSAAGLTMIFVWLAGSFALAQDAPGGTFAPVVEEEEDDAPGGTFAPVVEDEEDDEEDDEEEDEGPGGTFAPAPGGTFEPSGESDDAPGGTFAPAPGGTFEPGGEGDDAPGGTFAPAPGGTFEPGGESDDAPGGTFAPAPGGTFEPGREGDDAPGGTFAPGGDFSPEAQTEEEPGGTFAPGGNTGSEDPGSEFTPTQETETGDAGGSGGDDEIDFDSYWELLEEETGEDPLAEDVPDLEELADDAEGVRGVVIDNRYEEPVFGTTVTVELDGEEIATMTTGASGEFFFELEPGTYVLRFRNLGFTGAGYEIVVDNDAITDMANVRLVEDASTTMTMVVEGRADRESVAMQLRERRESTTVQDAVSSEQISQSGDSSASSAVRRVVGATIVDGRFLFVRGLGGRYTTVTLNGVPVPKTDPVYPGVELDIFPTDLLSNLTLYKNFTPELFGNFVGGSLDVRTQTYPEDFTLNWGVSVSGDTMTTFRDTNYYEGGGLDWLGFDDGTRGLPDEVPRDAFVQGATVVDPTSGFTDEEIEAIAESFENTWEVQERSTTLPNFSVKGTIGDTLDLGERRLGYLLTLQYSNSRGRLRDGQRANRDADLNVLDDYGVARGGGIQTSSEEVLWGALGTLTYELADGQDLTFLTMFNQSAEDQTRVLTGYSQEEDRNIERTEFQFVERTVFFNQLLGSHRRLLPSASPYHEMQLDWYGAFSTASRDEPDTRFLVRTDVPGQDGLLRWRPNPGSGERFFTELQQTDASGGVDFTLPRLERWEVKAGGDAVYTDRSFYARRFRNVFLGSDATVRDLPPEELFSAESIRRDQVWFSEVTQATDFYESQQLLLAGYAGTRINILEWLQLNGGVRYESFDRTVDAGSAVLDAGDDARANRVENDILPAAGVVFTINENMVVRANYGGTVARPQINEFAPFVTQDYVRRRTIAGNPDLIRTYVNNFDLRYEWFPSPTEVVAATVFYKDFRHPIERVVQDSRGQIVIFENAEGAQSFGGEAEARFSLGRITDPLEDVILAGNVTIVQSEITLQCTPAPEESQFECLENYTNSERPMAGQSPFVINLSLGWEPPNGFSIFGFYNVFGERIDDVGTVGRPDTYEQPQHLVDLAMGYEWGDHWSIRARARNIIGDDRDFTIGGELAERVPTPTSFSVSLGWDIGTQSDDDEEMLLEEGYVPPDGENVFGDPETMEPAPTTNDAEGAVSPDSTMESEPANEDAAPEVPAPAPPANDTEDAPGGTFAPAPEETPGGTFAPAADEGPGGTFAPAADEGPSGTFAPATDEGPGGTFAPATDEGPGGTFAPAADEGPGGTFAPATDEGPGGTFAPAADESPGGTFEPATDESPGGTFAPAADEGPGGTFAPAPETPSGTFVPGGGEGESEEDDSVNDEEAVDSDDESDDESAASEDDVE